MDNTPAALQPGRWVNWHRHEATNSTEKNRDMPVGAVREPVSPGADGRDHSIASLPKKINITLEAKALRRCICSSDGNRPSWSYSVLPKLLSLTSMAFHELTKHSALHAITVNALCSDDVTSVMGGPPVEGR